MPKGTTSKETVETRSYAKKLFMDKFPEFLGSTSYTLAQHLGTFQPYDRNRTVCVVINISINVTKKINVSIHKTLSTTQFVVLHCLYY